MFVPDGQTIDSLWLVTVCLSSDDHMYGMVNSFLCLKPAVDVLNVPEFYKLFNSATAEVETSTSLPATLNLHRQQNIRMLLKKITCLDCNIMILVWPTCRIPAVGGLIVCEWVCVSEDMSPYCSSHDEWLIMKLCMYVGYHDANNVSNFGGDPVTHLNF